MAQASEHLVQLAMREHVSNTKAVARQKVVEQEKQDLQSQNAQLQQQALHDPLTRLYNRRRFRRHVEHGDGYSIINDECHDYATMLYYVDLGVMRRQLIDAGFESVIDLWDLEGRPTDDTATDNSIMVLARPSSEGRQ